MGKRSDFERRPQDKYFTPEDAVRRLARYLKPCRFAEPCAGDGTLIRLLEARGFECDWRSDIAPDALDIAEADALTLTAGDVFWADSIITNPPWRRDLLHPMIEHFMRLKPTWLLFDADWVHTRQSADLIKHCARIISVGRLKWIPGSKGMGKDNCAWYLFEADHKDGPKLTGRLRKS